jgi:hypothetical protein
MKFALILLLLAMANPYWSGRLRILTSGQQLFLLRELPFNRFEFRRWQSVLAVTLIGLLVGLDPAAVSAPRGLPAPPLWFALLTGLTVTWIWFLAMLPILRWWMRRSGRWNGQGDLFNLVAAAWLVADTLSAAITALGVPALFTLPLWLYSVWVGGNALSGAMPKASLGYSITGIVIGLIPAIAASFLATFGLGVLLGIAAR